MTGAAGIEPQTSRSRVQRLNRSATRNLIFSACKAILFNSPLVAYLAAVIIIKVFIT